MEVLEVGKIADSGYVVETIGYVLELWWLCALAF